MAGDWIKVEHATAQKPEVSTMAEMLGISRREMVGVLIDYMIWLDVNAGHENVTHVSRKCLDDVLHCNGLSAALECVGWVSFDDQKREMTVKNYDRHNGSSAKSRTLATDRKRSQRSRNSHAQSVTREEKRRDISTSLRSVDKRAVRLTDEWELPDDWKTWALQERGDWQDADAIRCSLDFRDHWLGKGETRANWLATWRKWVRNDLKFNGQRKGQQHGTDEKHQRRSATLDGLTGGRQEPRVIDAND